MKVAVERARAWLFDIFAHDYGEKMRINRALYRKKMGLEQDDIPYPGALKDSNNETVTNNFNYYGGGILKGMLIAAAMGTGLGGAALGAYQLLKGAAPANPAVAPANPSQGSSGPPTAKEGPPGKDGKDSPVQAWDAIYEEQQPDGTWKQVRRERLVEGK